ncbi:unnamed protein product [Lampetra fluviatilis]
MTTAGGDVARNRFRHRGARGGPVVTWSPGPGHVRASYGDAGDEDDASSFGYKRFGTSGTEDTQRHHRQHHLHQQQQQHHHHSRQRQHHS